MQINKVVRIGSLPKTGSTFCKIKFEDGKLSISGAEGPKANGDCKGGCGQIVMHMSPADPFTFAPGWSADLLAQFLLLWDQWHLNDMQAGSPAQHNELARHTYERGMGDHFTWAKKTLEHVGLQPDQSYIYNGKPYSYGTARLKIEVPDHVLSFLQSLPETDVQPAWV